MAGEPTSPLLSQVELGSLLAGTVRSILDTQRQMDDYARQQADLYMKTPEGQLAIPPLWYTFKNVAIELEMSAAVQASADASRPGPQLFCRLVNPQSVGLFGYQASAGMRVRVVLGPNGMVPVKSEAGKTPSEEPK